MKKSYKGKCYTFCGKFLHGGKKRKENTYKGANTILPSKPIIGHHLKVFMETKKANRMHQTIMT
jgi:hypothetical protein